MKILNNIYRIFKRPESVFRCACCDNIIVKYLPIAEYFKNEQEKYGTVPWRNEMINIEKYSCPFCGASDRERAYALWMNRELSKQECFNILEIAPAKSLNNFIKRVFPFAQYKSADLYMQDVDYKLDIMDMHQIADGSIDFFICSHVLEHVPDDRKAMSELRRILKNSGRGILVVPLDLNQQKTDEDILCTDIGERWRRFGQGDHLRKYAKNDFLNRLIEMRFKVQQCGTEYFGKKAVRENCLTNTAKVYIVSRQ